MDNYRAMQVAIMETYLFKIPALIIAFTMHEFVKALISSKLGDDTPAKFGRLTLNPLKQLDPIGFILGMIFGLGFGKPVKTSALYYSDRKKGTLMTYSIPSIVNIVIGIIFGMISAIYGRYFGNTAVRSVYVIYSILYQIAILNFANGIFSMLPVKPLDGQVFWSYFISPGANMSFQRNERMIQMILFMLLLFGILSGFIFSITGVIIPHIDITLPI